MRRRLHDLQLIDVWRVLHPLDRDFTYFSSVHSSYTRIDYLFVSHFELSSVTEAKIHSRTWSDHALLSLSMMSSHSRPKHFQWRLNTSLFTDPMVVTTIAEALEYYFDENDKNETTPVTLWEAHKATIRGQLIGIASKKKKERLLETNQLLLDIRSLELSHMRSHDITVYGQLLLKRARLAELSNLQLHHTILKTKCFFAYNENKPGRLLARMLRKKRAQTYIPCIRSTSGQVASLPDDIVASFRDYYLGLYSSAPVDTPALRHSITEYLTPRIHRRLTGVESASLNDPITTAELASVLKKQKNGKSPGPDGFPTEYYKKYREILLPRLARSLNAIKDGTPIHTQALQAAIAIIPKEGKDTSLCTSYRPISLLNCDLKLFSSVLAMRLQPYVPHLVRKDQVGFVPGREARDGTLRALNAIHTASHTGTPMLLLSTDAEKAFDRVAWPFLFETLNAMGVSGSYLTWLAALYSRPTAMVRVNGALSNPFEIRNGTRQGCPLSPLLFALTLEPFLESVRLNPNISGLRGRTREHKLSAYADDMLFMVTNPRVSLPEIIAEFDMYSAYSNLRINMSKSEILNINLSGALVRELRCTLPFNWCEGKMRFLGIWLPPDLTKLYDINFPPLWDALQTDLKEWSSLKISWFGRVGVLKMNILPRLLYLFSTVPVLLPPDFLASIRRTLSRFVWSQTRPRVRLHTMMLPKQAGGVAYPDVCRYFLASHLIRVVEWSTGGRGALWLDLEGDAVTVPLWALPWISRSDRPGDVTSHPLLAATLRVWDRTARSHRLSTFPSPLLPLMHNPAFPANLRMSLRGSLGDPRRVRVIHLTRDSVLHPPWVISPRPTPPTILELFNYRQLTHYLRSLPGRHRLLREPTQFENLCLSNTPLSHGLSVLSAVLRGSDSAEPPSHEVRWDRALGAVLGEEDWTKTYTLTHRGTRQ
uniref:Reverse transcriptase domain-containing protein n=1 Tax=Leptobrachium leishanense TaxID=445787 RepID=A0A8C5PAU0_9ANUR